MKILKFHCRNPRFYGMLFSEKYTMTIQEEKDMARGKYAHRGGGVKLPVVLIMLIVAILAVIFAVTALVKALNWR